MWGGPIGRQIQYDKPIVEDGSGVEANMKYGDETANC